MRAEGSDGVRGDRAIPAPIEVLGRLPTGRSLVQELAAAARSRGYRSSVAEEIREVHVALAEVEIPTAETAEARRRVAAATGEEERLKERVAAARGDLRGRRAVDAPTEDALAELRSAAAALSAAQTERIAAEQAFERAQRRAAAAWDARERRLRLQDRLENRRRTARVELAEEVYPAFREALDAVPTGDPNDAGAAPSDYRGPDLAASLAAVRIADVDGPVIVGEDVIEVCAGFSLINAGRETGRRPPATKRERPGETLTRIERVIEVPVKAAGGL